MGALKLDLVTALYKACQGDSGIKEFDARSGKTRTGKGKGKAASDVDQVDLARVRVYFPSRETVLQCRGGTDVSSTRRPWNFSLHWANRNFSPEAR